MIALATIVIELVADPGSPFCCYLCGVLKQLLTLNYQKKVVNFLRLILASIISRHNKELMLLSVCSNVAVQFLDNSNQIAFDLHTIQPSVSCVTINKCNCILVPHRLNRIDWTEDEKMFILTCANGSLAQVIQW
jgi:hypothetical protein